MKNTTAQINIKLFVIILPLIALILTPNIAQAKEKNGSMSKGEAEKYIREVFKDRKKSEVDKVVAVFKAESNLNCKAKSHTNDVGIAQINKVHWKRFGGKDKLLNDCRHNIRVAKQIYKEWGNSLRPWSTYNNGRYKKFLKK